LNKGLILVISKS